MNEILRELGFSRSDRAVLIHFDDLGSCQATLPAFEDLLEFGLVRSASVMVPCPWFPAAMDLRRRSPEIDVGVHLTLTSEWPSYRWRAVTGAPELALGSAGALPETTELLENVAEDRCVERELRRQVELFRAHEAEPDHLDTHMFACMRPRWFPYYVRLLLELGVPGLLLRGGAERWGGGEEVTGWIERAAAAGRPIFDHLVSLRPGGRPEQRESAVRSILEELPPGLSCLLIHPAVDTPELRAHDPDWRFRVADYETFLSKPLRSFVADRGLQLVDYRVLRSSAAFDRTRDEI